MTEASASPSASSASPAGPPFAERVREFFTLQSAEREVKALPEGPCAVARRQLAIAFQKRDAAETLWPRGSCAEALKLARVALETAASALDELAAATDGKLAWVTGAQGLASTARDKAGARPLPEIESEATPEDEETFRLLVESVLGVQRVVTPHLAGVAELRHVRIARAAWAGFAAIAAVAAIAWILHTPDFRSAVASGQTVGAGFAPGVEDGPAFAIDGETKTIWNLPNGQLGWIELTLWKPRRVRGLRIMSDNPPWHDRGIKEGHVQCLLGADVVKETDVTFAPLAPRGTQSGTWTDVTLDAPKCDRIRIEARSFVGQSVAVNEVELK
jgi:hypothetical protein